MSFKWSIAALLLLTGCSTSATLKRTNYAAYDVTIEGGDTEAIYVKGPSGVERVPRREIEDIDHPGNVAAIIGGIVAAYGVVNIAMGLPKCMGSGGSSRSQPEEGGAAYCVGVFLPATVGFGVTGWGLGTYLASLSAMSAGVPKGEQGRVFVAPTGQVAGQPKTPGLMIGGTF